MAIPGIHTRLIFRTGGSRFGVRIRIFLRGEFLFQGYITSFLITNVECYVIVPFFRNDTTVKHSHLKGSCKLGLIFLKIGKKEIEDKNKTSERRKGAIRTLKGIDTQHIVWLNYKYTTCWG